MKKYLVRCICAPLLLLATLAAHGDDPAAESAIAPARTEADALARARLLHEVIRGALQVMHRDFFDDEAPGPIPSASLEDVFERLAETYDVELKWLVVETDVVNIDHQPADDFEKLAAKRLAKGAPFVQKLQGDRLRYAGPIRLGSQCLKCHLKSRNSNEDRTAGLLVALPLVKSDPPLDESN